MPRCKQCREKFITKSFLQKYCRKKDECLDAESIYSLEKLKQKRTKDWKIEKAVLKINTHSKEHKKALQDSINLLSRLIDNLFYNSCIDCGKPYGKQQDACHYHGRGANSSLKYNLHNLHSGSSQCNQWSDTHKQGYAEGLKKRYGSDYFETVVGLQLQYKELRLSNVEINDKLILVRKLIREFNTFYFKDGVSARTILNSIIGIYKQ